MRDFRVAAQQREKQVSKQPGPQRRNGSSSPSAGRKTRSAKATQRSARSLSDQASLSRPSRSLQERATGIAQDAAERAVDVASEGASHLSRRMASLLDQKMLDGVDVISHVARTTHAAADDLDDEIPQVAEAIRVVADSIEDYAAQLRERSVQDLVGSAAQFTRRQPGLVFGAAALLGFLAFRAFRTASAPVLPRPSNVAARTNGPARQAPRAARRKNPGSKANANAG